MSSNSNIVSFERHVPEVEALVKRLSVEIAKSVHKEGMDNAEFLVNYQAATIEVIRYLCELTKTGIEAYQNKERS